jgi:hypothetical protein
MWPASINGDAVPIVRKPDGTLVVGVRITLRPGRDDDLITLVLSAKKLAPAIREAMRSGVVKDVFAETKSIPEELSSIGIEL